MYLKVVIKQSEAGWPQTSIWNRMKLGATSSTRPSLTQTFYGMVLPGMLETARPSNKRAHDRDHDTQLLPEQLNRAFQEAREAAGITGENQVSFHKIRSVGGALLHNQQS